MHLKASDSFRRYLLSSAVIGLTLATSIPLARAYQTFPPWHLGIGNHSNCLTYTYYIAASWSPCVESIEQAMQFDTSAGGPIRAWDNSYATWFKATPGSNLIYDQIEFDNYTPLGPTDGSPNWQIGALNELHDTNTGQCMVDILPPRVNEIACNGWDNRQYMSLIEAAASSSNVVHAYYPVVNENLVLDIAGPTQRYQPVEINTANGSLAQEWGWYNGTIRTATDPLMCLTAASTSTGAAVYLADCNVFPYQKWVPVAPHQMVLEGTELCLDVPGISLNAGTQLWVWPCNGGLNEQWNVPPTIQWLR